VVPALLAYAGVVGFAAVDGGFFPRWWGVGTILFACAAALALLVRRPALPRRALLFVATLAALAALTALSAVWSESVPLTALEVQRAFLYVAAALAAVVVTPPERKHALLGGTLAAAVTVAVWNLAVRIRDAGEVVDLGNRGVLAEPVGYENALGLLCALGLLLALGLRARPELRAAGAVPLAAVLAASGSRAGWLALAVGTLILVALEPRALRAPGLLVGAAGAAIVAAATPTLEPDVALERAEGGALPLAAALVALVLIAAALALAGPRLEALVPLPDRAGRRLRLAALGAIALLLAVGLVGIGDQRRNYWEVALDQARENPILGDGAGTFVRHWLAHRDVPFGGRDAHGLFVETLAELGPAGLALVALALAVPLFAARRMPVAAAALAAFAAHAAFDWDWEMPVVTLAALFCATALVLTDDRRATLQAPLAGAALALALLALPNLVGQAALARSESTADRGDFDASADAARRGHRVLPWDTAPLLRLSVTELGRGDSAAARRAIRSAIDRDPGDPRLWLVLADFSTGAERERALERVEELDPLGAPASDG
jgi:hypothetical protein